MSYSLTRTSEEGWMAILEDIRNAKTSIDCELYLIDIDDVGLYLLNALRQKSREGVKVRLLADAVGSYSFYTASAIKAEVRKDGIQLVFFNHLIPWYPRSINLWYFRDHRRSIIIDGITVYTGSICFSKNMEGWRETMLRLQVPETVADIQDAFERMWKLSKEKLFLPRPMPRSKEWTYLTNAPIPGKYYYYKALIDLIRASKKEMYLATPYFVPDYLFFRALYRAAKRGVIIHLIIPKESNHPFVGYAGDFFKERLIKKGALIYHYSKNMLHSKVAVFDDVACTVGSMNLDNISLRYNFEGGLIIRNQECIDELRNQLKEDIKDVPPLTLSEWHSRPLRDKIMMYLTWPIRKLL